MIFVGLNQGDQKVGEKVAKSYKKVAKNAKAVFSR